MVKKLKPNNLAIYNYVKEHEDENITAVDIANATGIPIKSVNPIITMSFQKNRDEDKNEVPLMKRVEAEVEEPDGTHKKVKLIKLTDEGRNIEIEEIDG